MLLISQNSEVANHLHQDYILIFLIVWIWGWLLFRDFLATINIAVSGISELKCACDSMSLYSYEAIRSLWMSAVGK